MAREKKKLGLLMRILLAVMVVVSIVAFINSVMYYNERLPEKEEKEAQIADLKEEKEELEDLVTSPQDERYIVRFARKFWGLFFPDEEVYINDSGN